LQEQLGREINPKIFTVKEWQKLMRDNRAFVHDVLSKTKLFIIGNEQQLQIHEASHQSKKLNRNQS
jgi:CRISPR/Cas system CMR-associated protein Cmr1 (group 7 of RAMP superfamily)